MNRLVILSFPNIAAFIIFFAVCSNIFSGYQSFTQACPKNLWCTSNIFWFFINAHTFSIGSFFLQINTHHTVWCHPIIWKFYVVNVILWNELCSILMQKVNYVDEFSKVNEIRKIKFIIFKIYKNSKKARNNATKFGTTKWDQNQQRMTR